MKTIIAIVVGLIIITGGIFWYQYAAKTPIPAAETESTTTDQTDKNQLPVKLFGLPEISRHATSTDCWFAINGKVYDVTQFIAGSKHPGGAAILAGCGKDATTLFETRPMGSNTPHSETARGFLPNFYIGDLAQ
jgi:cytochrome b involved in lipid metabolism